MQKPQQSLDRISWANALGGYRAVDQYTEDRFFPTEKNSDAFSFAKAFDPMKSNFYVTGPTGSGKSHLAAIAARVNRSHQRFLSEAVMTIKQSDIARRVRSCDGAAEESDVVHGIANKHILVVDDLGVGKDTEFSLSLIYEIIDWRYMNLRGGLIITSNLTLDEIAAKMGDDRVASRIAGMCRVFSLCGERDWRVGAKL